MASTSGTSSGSSTMVTNSGSDEDLRALMNERKRKRMISNRESARRSRMRKQKHLDDLMAQVSQLQNENHQILTRVSITTQRYLNVEAENSVLRAQANELSRWLQSLSDIIDSLNGCNNNIGGADGGGDCGGFNVAMIGFNEMDDHSFFNPFNLAYLNQPIMASADNNMFQY